MPRMHLVKEHLVMSEPSVPPRSRRRSRHLYRELIHTLHQRYHREWVRAERLERELVVARGRFGAILDGLRRLKRWLRPGRCSATEVYPPLGPTLAEDSGPVSGRVSIIIPFADRLELLRGCLRSLRGGTYRDFELVLVDNGSRERRTRRYLERVRERRWASVVDCPGPFNFSWLCNEGAKRAAGDYLLFLNNDTEVLTPDWLERLLRIARRPEVGVVGATLLYPDGTIQHAGLFPRRDGRWIHAYRGCPGDLDALQSIRVVPAVSAACLMMRRAEFLAVGGFDERLPVTYNDVDLCGRVRARQRLVVVTPWARLLHFECLSRGFSDDDPGTGHLSRLEQFPPLAPAPTRTGC